MRGLSSERITWESWMPTAIDWAQAHPADGQTIEVESIPGSGDLIQDCRDTAGAMHVFHVPRTGWADLAR